MSTIESNGPVLEAISLDVLSWREQRLLLTGLNWQVAAGEYWLIGGSNRSGKTDLLMTLAGLHRPAGGTLQLFGWDATEASEAELLRRRTRVGFVFKDGGRMFNNMTVAENVALALCYHNNTSPVESEPEVADVLALTGLTELAGASTTDLGLDWQRRVGLARALALKPDLLFLDEPVSGLELRQRLWWRELLARLSREHKITVIVATNDFSLWRGDQQRHAVIRQKEWKVLEAGGEEPAIE